MRLIAAAVLLVAPIASAQDFKGVPLGATEDEARFAVSQFAYEWSCHADPAREDRRACVVQNFSYAGAQALPSTLYFDRGRLSVVVVSIPLSSLDAAVDALTARHGPPKSTRETPVRNGFGAQMVRRETQWLPTPQTVVTATGPGATVDEATVVIATRAALSATKASTRARGDV